MANISLKDNIYAYLSGCISLTATGTTFGWGQMPDTAVTKKIIVYSMISDLSPADDLGKSKLRNQRWRFWVCVPDTETNGKSTSLNISLKLMDNLNNVRGSFGSTYIHYSEIDTNSDPFYDITSKSWIVIQDYKLKMKTLE